jgi:hypothetical protein
VWKADVIRVLLATVDPNYVETVMAMTTMMVTVAAAAAAATAAAYLQA